MAKDTRVRIVEWRKARSLTQEQLAERSGMPQSKISRIETGSSEASVEDLETIVTAGLKLTMVEFYGVDAPRLRAS